MWLGWYTYSLFTIQHSMFNIIQYKRLFFVCVTTLVYLAITPNIASYYSFPFQRLKKKNSTICTKPNSTTFICIFALIYIAASLVEPNRVELSFALNEVNVRFEILIFFLFTWNSVREKRVLWLRARKDKVYVYVLNCWIPLSFSFILHMVERSRSLDIFSIFFLSFM